jgi:Tol biopolymer transport system component
MKMKAELFSTGLVAVIFAISGSGLFSDAAGQNSSQQVFRDSTLVDKIAFYSGRYGNREICLVNSDGTGFERLINNTAHDECPLFSPDSKKIAIISNRDGNYEIYLMNPDGSAQQRLTHSRENELHTDWSPDGNKIIYAHLVLNLFYAEIHIQNLDGSGDVALTQNSRSENPIWSADAKQIAFQSS